VAAGPGTRPEPSDRPDQPGVAEPHTPPSATPAQHRPAAPVFRPTGQEDLAPPALPSKVEANLAALRVLREVQAQGRPADPAEQKVLARWAGWGAVPQVFDEDKPRYAQAREELRTLLDDAEYRAASRTTLNAHYTDAELVQAIWQAMVDSGFDQTVGRVLEPGCGSGTFLGFAPAAATRLIGVELDPTTAAIAALLYPHADIRAQSFAHTRLPEAFVDLSIGNVPFAKVALHDPAHNAAGHSLHNHFIVKALHLTRPGGVVAVLTSHWTMDAENPAARREIASLGELVHAVRLPTHIHQRAAGTSVITDLLILRRRQLDEDPAAGPAWERTAPIGGDTELTVNMNEYFLHHPENVLGDVEIVMGQFGPELQVTTGRDVNDRHAFAGHLQAAFLPYRDGARPPLFQPDHSPTVGTAVTVRDAPAHLLEDHLDPTVDGTFTVVIGGQLHPHPVPASQAAELTALLGLRDTITALLAGEAASLSATAELDYLRATLGDQYDAYTVRYGPINRVSMRRTGRVDPDTGEDKMATIRPPQGRFRTDPRAMAVYALEEYDAATGTATKAPVFTQRVVAPRAPRLGADTPADAVAICLDTFGEVHLPEVARLLGRDEATTHKALQGLVFNDPDHPERLIPAPAYLSGNVRTKLAAALAAHQGETAAAEADEVQPAAVNRWAENVAALREVIPTDLTPAEIDARLGAGWIGAGPVKQFLTEILDDRSVKVENPGGSTWAIKGERHSVLATTTWGTDRMPAIDLAEALCEQRQIKVMDHFPDGTSVLNLNDTVAAQEKAAELAEKFTEWVWEDPDRAETLAATYNETFNAIVLRSYDGAHRDLPGMAITFTPRPHQYAAVERIVSEPSVLLAHEVGAGKTAEMIIGCQELRRLGMATKPAVVVPNHMLEQFSREWLQLYPQARILGASTEDLAGPEKRRLLIGRIATGDWDAVILSRSAFERIPLSPGAQRDYLDTQLEEMRRQLDNARGGDGLTVKRLEGSLLRAEERLNRLLDGANDVGISFEETGIDYLMVDEAHGYKNLRTISNIPGIAIEGSQRASDLDMKVAWLRDRHGTRVATFATATPIANSVSEAYVMQRFLRPDVLDDAGLTDFDSWAATFGEVTTDLELSPDGSRYRMQARFAKFRNVPELLRMWHLSADIKTAEDLQLPTPALAGGHAETVVAPPTPQLSAFMRELSDRADRVQSRGVDPAEDNMLRIATHGRMAALDLRLLQRDPGQDTKLVIAADRIAGIYHQHADDSFGAQPRPGALQLVFCDLGTPREGWNVYDELRELLVDRGVPAPGVRFVHEAGNDREKGAMFAAARTGAISVLIGSTERMGVGTNVQARAIALHHLDCPWRPADIAQREGRILRQGNLNPEVQIARYVSEGSFDAYLWQTVERKARFIGQVMRGRLDVREIEDIGDTALSYSEVKALATGNPLVLDKARADSELNRLERLERAHVRTARSLQTTIDRAEARIPVLQAQVAHLDFFIPRYQHTRGDAFTMTVGERQYTERTPAAVALRDTLVQLRRHPDGERITAGSPAPIGAIGGFTITAHPSLVHEGEVRVSLAEIPRSEIVVTPFELLSDRPGGLVTRLENRAAALPATRDEIGEEITKMATERGRAAEAITTPFAHHQALHDVRAHAAALAAQLAASSREDHDEAADVSPAPPGADGPLAGAYAVEVTYAGDDRSTFFGPLPNEHIARRIAESFDTADDPDVHQVDVVAWDQLSPHDFVNPVAEDYHYPTGDVGVAVPARAFGDPITRTALAHPTVSAPEGTPARRWEDLCRQLDAAIVTDPHWHVLATALDRAAAAGVDIPATLRELTQEQALDADHPARSLHYSLLNDHPAAMTSPVHLADRQHTGEARVQSPPPATPRRAPGR
jgi:N12 class adenine-specific DNA methylase